jgi:hypothetical protein
MFSKKQKIKDATPVLLIGVSSIDIGYEQAISI